MYVVVRVRCRGKESSRSLSHLLMSFLFLYTNHQVLTHSVVLNPYNPITTECTYQRQCTVSTLTGTKDQTADAIITVLLDQTHWKQK